ncbi:MAG: tetratricopeptide repeat protein [Proteobacteria bacterium]|nr:tetratricopeptide repeat protein [Pseudomonadota bacterium]
MSADATSKLKHALALHCDGQIAEANAIYIDIAKGIPSDPKALRLVGILALKANNENAAAAFFERGLRLAPQDIELLEASAMLMLKRGQPGSALGRLIKARDVDPRQANIHIAIGQAQQALHRHQEALGSFKQALHFDSSSARAHNFIGVSLRALCAHEKAREMFETAHRLRSSWALPLANLGLLHLDQQKHAKAASVFHEALQKEKDCLLALVGLSHAEREQDRHDIALVHARTAVDLAPMDSEAHNALGLALQASGMLEEATVAYQRAMDLQPKRARYLINRGDVLRRQGDLDGASAVLKRALTLSPTSVDAHIGFGNVRMAQGDLSAALSCWERAAQLTPSREAAYLNLALALVALGRLQAGIDTLRRGLKVHRHSSALHSRLALLLGISPWATPSGIRRAAEQWAALAPKRQGTMAPIDSSKPLRVLFVPGDSPIPWVSSLLGALVEHFDDTRFDVHILPPGAPPPEAHISIDVAGHGIGNQLSLFSARHSPVQLTWLGALSTTGLGLDGIIGDEFVLPHDCQEELSEPIIRLPRCFVGFVEPNSSPQPTPPPLLMNEATTFGCFSHPARINLTVVKTWAQLLGCGSARLLLHHDAFREQSAIDSYRAAFDDVGLGHRVDFACSETDLQRLTWYGQVDVLLDTFPCGDIFAAFEGLWMGVPVVTLAGDRMNGRATTSLLAAISRLEWVCSSTDEYVGLANKMASTKSALTTWRQELRSSILDSAVCDLHGLARSLQEIWGELSAP